MIQFNKINQEAPYLLFKSKYDEALASGQKNIEAIAISSYNTQMHEVDSRFVNLKFIINDEFIFFSNYNSPKSNAFKSHNQIAACIYWSTINFQIRMKAKIKKMSAQFNQDYFQGRSKEKNALAISSDQSSVISSYDLVTEKYKYAKKNNNLSKCPDYWGGYCFRPYEIEFWEGHESRINKRNLYKLEHNDWQHYVLEP